MWKDLLTEISKTNRFMRINSPASKDALIELEQALAVALPYDEVSLLLEVNGDNDLILSTESIKEINKMMRDSECWSNMDKTLFVLRNGCGDYMGYLVEEDGTIEDSNIYNWDHEQNEIRIFASNLQEGIVKLYKD